jgi:hypothetical protein
MKKNEEFAYNFNSHALISPGYLTCKLPDIVIDELKESIDDVLNLSEKSSEIEKIDCRDKLAGNISCEYILKITPKIRYLTESLSEEYFKVFNMERPNHYYNRYNNATYRYKLSSLWVNIQKKNEFNPIHYHGGIFSFVIWVKIPYNLEDELKIYEKSPNSSASLFSFVYSDPYGKMCTEILNIDKTWEWKIALFPASLSHVVYPFFTSDESRISVSGNVFYDLVPNEN